jgi:hypothetical protein
LHARTHACTRARKHTGARAHSRYVRIKTHTRARAALHHTTPELGRHTMWATPRSLR